jgi:cytochrome c553
VRLRAALPPVLLVASALAGRAADAPDFVREVRPILAAHCFNCHGFDAGARSLTGDR